MREPKGGLRAGAPALVKWNRGRRNFEINAMNGKSSSLKRLTDPGAIDIQIRLVVNLLFSPNPLLPVELETL